MSWFELSWGKDLNQVTSTFAIKIGKKSCSELSWGKDLNQVSSTFAITKKIEEKKKDKKVHVSFNTKTDRRMDGQCMPGIRCQPGPNTKFHREFICRNWGIGGCKYVGVQDRALKFYPDANIQITRGSSSLNTTT